MTLRDAVYWAFLLVVIGGTGIWLYYEYQQTRPCTNPIAYAIGTVDPRFGTTKATLLADAKAAAAIWNNAVGKTVLTYNPQAAMKINLIYDSREANAKIGIAITQEQDALDSQRAAIDAEQADYSAKLAAYNAKVTAINARGGATRQEAAELNAERQALEEESASIDADIARFNASVKALNTVVANFNSTAGYTFEEGQFVEDAQGTRINIFEFVGNTQLERVLAHELGHAIGLDHNSNPASIMYAENERGNLKPTVDDVNSLKALCGLK